MNIHENQRIPGLHQGAQSGQNERVDELNARFVGRQFTDNKLKPNLSIRPVQTKYTHFSVLDDRPKSKVEAEKFEEFKTSNNFYPGTQSAPPYGYFSNVDVETNLRNQTKSLQHGASANTYIPSTESDLYKTEVVGYQANQTHPLLFAKPSIEGPDTLHLSNIGQNKLFNHTRTQLRNN